MNNIQKTEYQIFLADIKEKIYQSQLKAMQAVNKELIALYWEIGKNIIEKQEKSAWGKGIVENLSIDLQHEFPGIKGFSVQNLWYMRQLYLTYKDNEKLQPLVGEISWTHNTIIMSKCKDDFEREFYIRMSRKYGWSKSILIHQIEGGAYNRFLLNQTNFDKSLSDKYKHQAKLAVKDSYNFDFLELAEDYKERELELGLLMNIRKFLLEMGGDFAFIGNQHKLSVGNEDFFIDLLLYHRRLKSLIAIELKTVAFQPEFAGKMQFYLAVLDDKVKVEGENSSIGIIICKSKNRTIVEYTLNKTNSPMGIADYSISNTLPNELKGLLPSADQIINLLNEIEI